MASRKRGGPRANIAHQGGPGVPSLAHLWKRMHVRLSSSCPPFVYCAPASIDYDDDRHDTEKTSQPTEQTGGRIRRRGTKVRHAALPAVFVSWPSVPLRKLVSHMVHPPSSKSILEINPCHYNRDFVTGFRKRKNQRRKEAQEQLEQKAKEAKSEARRKVQKNSAA